MPNNKPRSAAMCIKRMICGGMVGGMMLLGGCLSSVKPTAQVATNIDPKTAEPSYWWGQEAYSKVYGNNFEALWNGAERAARNRFFDLDRQDYRDGVLTTVPLVSKQDWELWRRDVVDKNDLDLSSTSTIRRTIRFDIRKRDDGGYIAEPKVLVERLSLNGKRITAVVDYGSAFAPQPTEPNTGPGDPVPPNMYWYAIGRDTALEKVLAEDIADWVTTHPQG